MAIDVTGVGVSPLQGLGGLDSQTLATEFRNSLTLAQNATPPVADGVQSLQTVPQQSADIVVHGSHFSKNTMVHRALEQVQGVVNLGRDLEQRGKADLSKMPSLEGANVDKQLVSTSLNDLRSAFDFAIRTYFLSKVVSESASGLKSLWMAQ